MDVPALKTLAARATLRALGHIDEPLYLTLPIDICVVLEAVGMTGFSQVYLNRYMVGCESEWYDGGGQRAPDLVPMYELRSPFHPDKTVTRQGCERDLYYPPDYEVCLCSLEPIIFRSAAGSRPRGPRGVPSAGS